MVGKIKRLYSAVIDRVVFRLFGGVYAARRKGVVVGNNCRIYIRDFGSEPFLISIGNDVTITSGVSIITHDGSTWLVRDDQGNRYQHYAPILIGDHVFIGINSIILPGITIGSNVVIGAGSVVTKDIADGAIVAGNPAKPIGRYVEFEDKIKKTYVNECDLDSRSGYRKKVESAIYLERNRNSN